jgi:hypothetical protein
MYTYIIGEEIAHEYLEELEKEEVWVKIYSKKTKIK